MTAYDTRPGSGGGGRVNSSQVSWWSVHEHVQPVLDAAGSWPMAGTPAWCALDDDDPAKGAAIYDAAQHWALRLETAQEARCEASKAVATAADWSAVSQEIRNLRSSNRIRRVS